MPGEKTSIDNIDIQEGISEGEIYNCEVCHTIFLQSSECTSHLESHGRLHTVRDSYQCKVCNMTFARPATLVKHMQLHMIEKSYKCEACNKIFKKLGHLNIHKRSKACGKSYKCEICSKDFKRLCYLKAHGVVHTGETRFKCEVCHQKFTAPYSLKAHMRIHTGEKSFNCKVCGKDFRTSPHLKRHMYIHSGERPYGCEVCHKVFTSQWNLIVHNRLHTGEKPYDCEVCHKRFSDPSSYKSHSFIHVSEKPYQCELCEKSFATMYKLKKHRRSHSTARPYRCEGCRAAYKHAKSLMHHMEKCLPSLRGKIVEKEKSDDIEIDTEIEIREIKFEPVDEINLKCNDSNDSLMSEVSENHLGENGDSKNEDSMENKLEVANHLMSSIIDELSPAQKQVCYICLNYKNNFGIQFPELIFQLRKLCIFESEDYLTRTVVQMVEKYHDISNFNLLIPNKEMEKGLNPCDDFSHFENLFIKLNPLACSIFEKIKPEMAEDFEKI